MTNEDDLFRSKGYLKRKKKYEKKIVKREKRKAFNENIKNEIKKETHKKLIAIEEEKENALELMDEYYDEKPSHIIDPELYVAGIQQELARLRKKEWKILRKGLGTFTISKLVIRKIIDDKFSKRKEVKSEIDKKGEYEELLKLKSELQSVIEELTKENYQGPTKTR